MGEAESQFQVLALHLCIVADALDFELLFKTFRNAYYHVMDEGTVESVQGTVFDIIIRTGNEDLVAFHLNSDLFIQCTGECAFRTFYGDCMAVNLDFHTCRYRNRFSANSGHILPPTITRQTQELRRQDQLYELLCRS